MSYKFKMWYYTKAQADKVAAGLRKKGHTVKIGRSKNYNGEHGPYIYNVWYK